MSGRWRVVGFGFMAVLMLETLGASSAWAIPAFARKYGVSCNVCHSPNVPRLNDYGHRFLKLGFRVPEEIGKQPEYKEIGQYISMQGTMRYDVENFDHGRNTSGFHWNNATLFYGGPVTPNLSSFFELAVNDSNELEPLGQMAWLFGGPERYAQLRLGQMHSLLEVGWAGFNAPSGISAPQILASTLTNTDVPFTFDKEQRGLELSVGLTPDIRLIGQVLNGLDADGEGTTGTRDSDKSKDFLLAYEQMIGSKGSGLTAVFYRGIWKEAAGTTVNGQTLEDDDRFRRFTFYRYGLTGSWVFDTPFWPGHDSEIQGGAMFANDFGPSDYPAAKGNGNGQGYFVGLEQRFRDASLFTRLDLRNVKIAGPDNWRRRYTVGGAKMINDNLRLALEGFLNDQEATTDSIGFNAEAMFNF